MIYTYLIFNILVILGPILYLFFTENGRKIYSKKVPSMLLAILPIAIIFIIWDFYATEIGHWFFNPEYITGIKVINLPIEEVLFFFTVPFSLLFMYEALTDIIKREKYLSINGSILLLLAIFLTAIAVFARGEYTFIVLLSLAILLLATVFFRLEILFSRRYLIFIVIHYLLFFLFNLFLTSLPVVLYGAEYITGLRIVTIPIEDFIYSFVLSSSTLASYSHFKNLRK